jgi:LysM repeat protein
MTQRIQYLPLRLLILLIAVGVVFLLLSPRVEAGVEPQPAAQYLVKSGDTLWGITQSFATPEQDVRSLMGSIKKLSGLQNSTIHPGQVLLIPAEMVGS